MEADGIADDFRGGDDAIDLLGDKEDAGDGEDIDGGPAAEDRGIGRIRVVEPCDEASGDEGNDISDKGNDSDDGHHDANEESEWEAKEGEGDADEQAVDERDEDLAAEKGDHVAVDFGEGFDDFIFEF